MSSRVCTYVQRSTHRLKRVHNNFSGTHIYLALRSQIDQHFPSNSRIAFSEQKKDDLHSSVYFFIRTLEEYNINNRKINKVYTFLYHFFLSLDV